MVRSMKQVEPQIVGDRGWHTMSDDEFLVAIKGWAEQQFGQAPTAIREGVVPAACHSPAESGLNRHTRRRLERGEAFIHLFAGCQRWDHPGNSASIALDLERGYDLHSDSLFWYLLQLARGGDVSYLLAGPPCRSYTPLRARAEGPQGDGGPRVLRTREGEHRFGIPGLTPAELEMAHGDAILLFRTLLLAEVAAQSLRAKHSRLLSSIDKSPQRQEAVKGISKLFFGLEHPEDPQDYLGVGSGRDWSTIGVWPEVRSFCKRHGMFEACFHQGMLGHKKVKPTRMMISSGHLWERLHLVKVPKGALWKPSEASTLQQRMRDSSSWAAWAPQLVSYIQQSMLEWQKGEKYAQAEDEWRNVKLRQLIATLGSDSSVHEGYHLRGLKRGDTKAFKHHCLAGHRPWRSDCSACLDAMAYSRPHRRMQRSRACALSIDLSGPHRTIGAEDEEVGKPKYMIVGAYTFPVFGKEGEKVPKDEKLPNPEEFAAESEAEEAAPWEIPEEPPIARGLSARERKQLEHENKRWEGIVATCKDTNYRLVEIPLVEILPNKSTQVILGAFNRFYAKLRSWGPSSVSLALGLCR